MTEKTRAGIRTGGRITFILGLAALVGATGVYGLTSVSTVGQSADVIYEEELPVADASMEMTIAVQTELSALHAYLLGEDEALEEFNEGTGDFNQWYNYLYQQKMQLQSF